MVASSMLHLFDVFLHSVLLDDEGTSFITMPSLFFRCLIVFEVLFELEEVLVVVLGRTVLLWGYMSALDLKFVLFWNYWLRE